MREPLLEFILRYLRIKNILEYIETNKILLDIGCGVEGKFLKDIGPYLKEGLGFDKKVNASNLKNIKFRKIELYNKLPLSSNKVDYVTMLAVVEHLDKPIEILKECYRILKPDGRLILTTPSPLSKYILEFLAFKLNLLSREEISDHKYYFTSKKLKKILENKCKFRRVYTKTFQLGLNNLVIAIK